MSRTVPLLGLLSLAAVGLAAGFAVEPEGPGSQPAAARFVQSSFRFSKPAADRQAEEPAAPIRLTASDGTGLKSRVRRGYCRSIEVFRYRAAFS